MDNFTLTPHQLTITNLPFSGRVFLQGSAGCGKTTAAAARLRCLIESGIPAHQILIIVPQRTLAQAYYHVISQPDLPPGSVSEILTLGGLAQRMTQLFWPLLAHDAGFARPDVPPTFLNAEHAQYYMARIVEPLLNKGAFKTVTIERNRLYSQILSNLNSAASVGFSHQEIGERLKRAWIGKAEQLHVYDDVQHCASLFREYCLQHNLLDFSLALEVFRSQLWTSLLGRRYLTERYRHLVYDNIEEDIPTAHDVIGEWLPYFDSALLVLDSGGGHRSFLGADAKSAAALSKLCETSYTMDQSLVTPPELIAFENALCGSILRKPALNVPPEISQRVHLTYMQYLPQMVEAVCQRIGNLVNEQAVSPGDVAILAPFMSDSLRFAITTRLDRLGIAHRSHRPSRALRDEPAARCLLALAILAHPQWHLPLTRDALRFALMVAIEEIDLMRADILTRFLTEKAPHGQLILKDFEPLRKDYRERIGHHFGGLYNRLRDWINMYQSGEPAELDVFLSRLFGELLSQPDFGFHANYDAASAATRLIESVQTFRRAASEAPLIGDARPGGQEYIRMVLDGVLGSQYLPQWFDSDENAVFIAPAFTFLVSNRCAMHQFWLDVGASGWAERLDQPLTHAQVLRRDWVQGARWSDAWEVQASQASLARLVSGLVHRCGEHIYMYACGITENGNEQNGQLLRDFFRLIQQNPDLMEALDA